MASLACLAWSTWNCACAQGPATEVAPCPVFSMPGGVFTNALNLTLTADAATIRFTLDGSEPDESSRTWPGPITITNCVLVRARAYVPGRPPGPTVSHAYTVLSEDLAGFNSNLPLVILNTYGEEISGDNRTRGAVRVIDPGTRRAAITGPADHDGRCVLNIRGNVSRRYPKHSLTLRTIDELDDKRGVALLDMPKENEWILYAPYVDKSLMRDVLAYELSHRMGQWAPRTRYVEVFLNESRGPLGRSHYAGVYVLEERVSRARDRVNIKRIEPDDTTEPDITGGYLIKKDHPSRAPRARTQAERWRRRPDLPAAARMALPSGPGGFPGDPADFLDSLTNPPGAAAAERRFPRRRGPETNAEAAEPVTNYVGFLTRTGTGPGSESRHYPDSEITPDPDGFSTAMQRIHFFYVEPEPDEITAVQRAWLLEHFNAFERALYGPAFQDPLRGYRDYLDIDSFIDHHLLQEVAKNVDAFRFSTYFHKDRGGKIRLGPVWDMNLTFGNTRSYGTHDPKHWLWPYLDDQGYSYFRRLFEDADFGQRYVDRWAELRAGPWATSKVLAFIDQTTARLEEAQRRNFVRWPVLGEEIRPNYFVGTNYASEVRWLRDWVEARLAWIDRQFLPTPGFVVFGAGPQSRIELTTPVRNATVCFTLDGTDPRAPGGKLSPQAAVFTAPVAWTEKARLCARVRRGDRWSSPLWIGSGGTRGQPPAGT